MSEATNLDEGEKLNRLRGLLHELKEARETNKIEQYVPYGHPETLCPDGALWKEKHNSGEWDYWSNHGFQWEFHHARDKEGNLAEQRALVCANQIGKTLCAGFETAMHLTGVYPDWWEGHRFDRPVSFIAAGVTNDRTRDIVQAELFGDPHDPNMLGTGSIPRQLIGRMTRKPGVPQALSYAMVRHVSGGWSKISLMSYEQGYESFMGGRADGSWCDEEPPLSVWSQIQRAVFAKRDAVLYLTFTPEQGMTDVVDQFLNYPQKGQATVRATWDDAPHMTKKEREKKINSLSPHERDMRTKGVPLMGSGLVFPVADEDIMVEPFEIPIHWARGVGIDFGWDHPFAAAFVAWDRDTDTLYIYDEYKESHATPPTHASAIKRKGHWLPVFWPHDGHQSDKGSGKSLSGQYFDEGLNMHWTHFTNPPGPGQDEGQGGQGMEAGVTEMLTRMETGTLKVFSHCQHWFEEKRQYHRKDGKIVKYKDDLISASRYAIQMRRFFHTKPVRKAETPAVAGMTNW